MLYCLRFCCLIHYYIYRWHTYGQASNFYSLLLLPYNSVAKLVFFLQTIKEKVFFFLTWPIFKYFLHILPPLQALYPKDNLSNCSSNGSIFEEGGARKESESVNFVNILSHLLYFLFQMITFAYKINKYT